MSTISANPTVPSPARMPASSRAPKSREIVPELSDAERRAVRELSQRDSEVRAHEAAHVAVGGTLVRGGAGFDYQVGPDGKRYAVGGEVSIDTSDVPGDPGATVAKTPGGTAGQGGMESAVENYQSISNGDAEKTGENRESFDVVA